MPSRDSSESQHLQMYVHTGYIQQKISLLLKCLQSCNGTSGIPNLSSIFWHITPPILLANLQMCDHTGYTLKNVSLLKVKCLQSCNGMSGIPNLQAVPAQNVSHTQVGVVELT